MPVAMLQLWSRWVVAVVICVCFVPLAVGTRAAGAAEGQPARGWRTPFGRLVKHRTQPTPVLSGDAAAKSIPIDESLSAPVETLANAELAEPAETIPAAAPQLPPVPDLAGPVVPVPPAPTLPTAEDFQRGVSLDALIAFADANHPALTTAYEQIQAQRGLALQAGLYPNPLLATASPQVAGSDSQFNVFASQDIVTAKKLKLDRAAVTRQVRQAEFSWVQTRFAILTPIRRQFYITLAAQYRFTVLTRLVDLATRSRDTSVRLAKAGEGARPDTLLLEIELDRATLALDNTQVQLKNGLRQLGVLVGVPELQIERLAGDLNEQLRNYELEQVRYEVISVNAQTGIASTEVDRTGIVLRRAIVEPIPNLSLMGGYQNQTTGRQQQGLFQVTVVVPLWNQNQGNIRAAEAQLAASRANVRRVELELARQTTDFMTALTAAQQRVDQYEERILPKARETLDLTLQLYSQGQIDFLRLLQSQKTLLEAELMRVDAQEVRWTAASDLAGLLQQEQFP